MAKRSPLVRFHDEEKLKNINGETLRLLNKYKIDMSLRELSPLSINGYINDLEQWFIFIYDNQANQCITELDEDDITEFLYFCKNEGNNSRRIKRRTSSISAFYNFLRKKRIVKENPVDFIDRSKKDIDVVTQTFLTKEQIAEMRDMLNENIAKAETLSQKHDALELKLYALFSLSTMARVNAVSNTAWAKIDFDNRVVNDVLEKEGKLVTLYFSEEVKALLLELKAFREANEIADGGFVFYTVYKGEYRPISSESLLSWCKKIGAMINVPTLHPHDFRHSGATLLKNSGMALEDVSQLLNHGGTDVTRKFYIKEDTRKLQAAKDGYEV